MTRNSYPRPRASFVFRCAAVALAAMQAFGFAPYSAVAQTARTNRTVTPIKHVIVIIGENRTFDELFGTYIPRHGQHVRNLLSEGIVNANGSPGPNYSRSEQFEANVTDQYTISPQDKSLYTHIPPLLTGSAPTAPSDTAPPPFQTLAVAEEADRGLAKGYDKFLLTGATGLPQGAIDTRLENVNNLDEGVYRVTPSIPYDAYTASPVHRFFQMWQQEDCNAYYATERDPSGCLHDLFPWVEVSVGAGSNGAPPPANFSDLSTGEGSVSMGFYNMASGDVPYLKQLADEYTLSDNYHQAVMGGTGANHIFLGYGDALYYTNGHGTPTPPPSNQIENPNPQSGTNNFYIQDGYSGGSYVDCADKTQPGVAAVVDYLRALERPVKPNCQPGRYYLVNNYNPGYLSNGALGITTTPYTIPPSSVRGIADELLDNNISFKWYGEDWDFSVKDPSLSNPYDQYCNICNFLEYSTRIMTSPSLRQEHIADLSQLYSDLDNSTLPAVSWVKPSGLNDGHPASSKIDLFEGFVKEILDHLQANPKLWATTAVFITVDEGGGYYDSGYIQPLDFFGDGTRIPLIVVSPYSKGGRVVHNYTDHVSTLKFIERNWGLSPITDRSRDNLPDPVVSPKNPYVPLNSPAIGDLFGAFNFGNHHDDDAGGGGQ